MEATFSWCKPKISCTAWSFKDNNQSKMHINGLKDLMYINNTGSKQLPCQMCFVDCFAESYMCQLQCVFVFATHAHTQLPIHSIKFWLCLVFGSQHFSYIWDSKPRGFYTAAIFRLMSKMKLSICAETSYDVTLMLIWWSAWFAIQPCFNVK